MWTRVHEDETLPALCISRIGRDKVGLRSIREGERIERKIEKWTESLSFRSTNIRDCESDLPTREEEGNPISDIDSETIRELIID